MFAQELANGVSASQAYENAGFKPDRGNASRLQQDDRIRQRVAQLLNERAKRHAKASEKAVRELGITKQWVLSKLVENAERALEREDGSTANRALELIGVEQGMFIKRTETGGPGDFSSLQSAEDVLEAVKRELGDETAALLSGLVGKRDDSEINDLAEVEPEVEAASQATEPALVHDGSETIN